TAANAIRHRATPAPTHSASPGHAPCAPPHRQVPPANAKPSAGSPPTDGQSPSRPTLHGPATTASTHRHGTSPWPGLNGFMNGLSSALDQSHACTPLIYRLFSISPAKPIDAF